MLLKAVLLSQIMALSLLIVACSGGNGAVPTDAPTVAQPTIPAPIEEPPHTHDEEPLHTHDEESLLAPPTASGLSMVMIFNAAAVDICAVSITLSTEIGRGDNVLDETLTPDQGIIYEIDDDVYNLLAIDCNDSEVDVRFGVPLGSENIIWAIGESVEPLSGSP